MLRGSWIQAREIFRLPLTPASDLPGSFRAAALYSQQKKWRTAEEDGEQALLLADRNVCDGFVAGVPCWRTMPLYCGRIQEAAGSNDGAAWRPVAGRFDQAPSWIQASSLQPGPVSSSRGYR